MTNVEKSRISYFTNFKSYIVCGLTVEETGKTTPHLTFDEK